MLLKSNNGNNNGHHRQVKTKDNVLYRCRESITEGIERREVEAATKQNKDHGGGFAVEERLKINYRSQSIDDTNAHTRI